MNPARETELHCRGCGKIGRFQGDWTRAGWREVFAEHGCPDCECSAFFCPDCPRANYAKTRPEVLGDVELIRNAADEIAELCRAVEQDSRFDEDYKIAEWHKIRPAELARFAAFLADFRRRLEKELAERPD